MLTTINKHCVKSKNKLSINQSGTSQQTQQSEFGLDFAFLYAKDLSDKDAMNIQVTSEENLPKINSWIVQDVEKVDLLPLVLTPEDLS